MWTTQNVQMRFKKASKYRQLTSAYCVLDNTYVFLFCDDFPALTTIYHVDRLGNILFEWQYKTTKRYCKMLNEEEMVVAPTGLAALEIINLRTHKVVYLNHAHNENYIQPKMDLTTEVYVFRQSQLLAVTSYKAKQGQDILDLVVKYYDWRVVKEGGKGELASYLVQNVMKCSIFQADEYSRIFIKRDKEQKIESICLSDKQKVEHITLSIKIDMLPGFYIQGLCQTVGDQFLVITKEIKEEEVQYYGHTQRRQVAVNNHVCLATVDWQSKQFRMITVHSEDPKIILFCAPHGIFIVGDRSQTDKWKLQVFGKQNIKISQCLELDKHRTNHSIFFSTCFDQPNLFVQLKDIMYSYEIETIVVARFGLEWGRKNIAMFFLLHIHDDFDDDLLMDAVELIVGK